MSTGERSTQEHIIPCTDLEFHVVIILTVAVVIGVLYSTYYSSIDQPNIQCDSWDLCPGDPLKSSPLKCGCGVQDTDTDGDGVPDCQDSCPTDPHKSSPLICGCGISEEDTNNNNIPDCLELADFELSKSSIHVCDCTDKITTVDSIEDRVYESSGPVLACWLTDGVFQEFSYPNVSAAEEDLKNFFATMFIIKDPSKEGRLIVRISDSHRRQILDALSHSDKNAMDFYELIWHNGITHTEAFQNLNDALDKYSEIPEMVSKMIKDPCGKIIDLYTTRAFKSEFLMLTHSSKSIIINEVII